jgi:hypothetical protein
LRERRGNEKWFFFKGFLILYPCDPVRARPLRYHASAPHSRLIWSDGCDPINQGRSNVPDLIITAPSCDGIRSVWSRSDSPDSLLHLTQVDQAFGPPLYWASSARSAIHTPLCPF